MSLKAETVQFIVKKYPHASALVRWHMRGRLQLCPYDKILKHIPTSGKVLDIGCGFGHLAWYLAHERPSLKYFGTDIDEEKIALAQNSAMGITSPNFKFGDITTMDDWSEPYDSIILLDVAYLMPWEIQKKIIAWALAHLNLGSESALLLKTNEVPKGMSGVRMLWEEWIMVNLLRRTKSSGTIQGVQDFQTYINYANELGFNCEIESMETYNPSFLLKFYR